MVARLGDPERQIIMERHLRHQAAALTDLGGLSGESVRQIEMKALKQRRRRPDEQQGAPLAGRHSKRAPGRCGQQHPLFASLSSTSA